MEKKFSRVVVIGDTFGIQQILRFLPKKCVSCIIAASIRPQYLQEISEIAHQQSVPLLVQPSYNSEEYSEFSRNIEAIKPDMFICNSYSMIIRRNVLDAVEGNAINLHWALLPKNRGPNPIQWVLIKGEEKIGVTIHYMDDEIDSGDIIAQKEIRVEGNDTWVSLKEKLHHLTNELLEDQMPKILSGINSRTPQIDTDASVNARLNSEFPFINWELMTDVEIYNLIRAQVAPLNGAYLIYHGERIHINRSISLAEVESLREKYA